MFIEEAEDMAAKRLSVSRAAASILENKARRRSTSDSDHLTKPCFCGRAKLAAHRAEEVNASELES